MARRLDRQIPLGGLKAYSGILGLKQQQLALQTGQAGLQTAQSQATVAKQTAKENQNLAQLLQDPVGNGIVDAQGNPTSSAEQIVLKAAPTTGADHYSAIVNAAQKKLQFNTSVNNLRTTERAEIGNTIGGAAADPNATASSIGAQLDGLVESKKDTPVYQDYLTIASSAKQLLNHSEQTQQQTGQIVPPEQSMVRNNGLTLARTLLGAAGTVGPSGLATPQPGAVNSGATQYQGAFQPALAGGGFKPATQIQNVAPPQVANTPAGLVSVGAGGSSASVVPSLGQAPGGLPANPSQPQAAAATGLATAVAGRVAGAQAAANNTIQSQDALHRVIDVLESSGTPATGKTFALNTDVRNALSSLGIDTSGATTSNELVKNLARYEASRATQVGLGGTDAARELAHFGSPNVNVDNRALLDITKQSLATEQAIAAYAKLQSSTQDPAQLQANEAKFRSIPNLIETYQYMQSKSPAEAERFLSLHGLSHKDVVTSASQLKAMGAL